MNSKKRLSESRDTINALQQKIKQMKTAAECRQEDSMPDLQDHGTEDDEEKIMNRSENTTHWNR